MYIWRLCTSSGNKGDCFPIGGLLQSDSQGSSNLSSQCGALSPVHVQMGFMSATLEIESKAAYLRNLPPCGILQEGWCWLCPPFSTMSVIHNLLTKTSDIVPVRIKTYKPAKLLTQTNYFTVVSQESPLVKWFSSCLASACDIFSMSVHPGRRILSLMSVLIALVAWAWIIYYCIWSSSLQPDGWKLLTWTTKVPLNPQVLAVKNWVISLKSAVVQCNRMCVASAQVWTTSRRLLLRAVMSWELTWRMARSQSMPIMTNFPLEMQETSTSSG